MTIVRLYGMSHLARSRKKTCPMYNCTHCAVEWMKVERIQYISVPSLFSTIPCAVVLAVPSPASPHHQIESLIKLDFGRRTEIISTTP